MLRLDRIDFTTATKCARCRRPLSLGIAHIVVDENGAEYAHGPWCAKQVAPDQHAPDFTKGARYDDADIEAGNAPEQGRVLTPAGETPAPARSGLNVATKTPANVSARDAITYLRLRQELMRDFPRVRYESLQPLYEKYRGGGLTDYDIDRIQRLMAAVERSSPLLSLESLMTAYAYHRVLRRAIEEETPRNRAYLTSLDDQLCQWLMLTKAQIAGANKWLLVQGKMQLTYCPVWNAVAQHAFANRATKPSANAGNDKTRLQGQRTERSQVQAGETDTP